MPKRITLNSKTLEALGITQKELDVYVKLLGLGSAPLRKIAEEAGLNRGTTYDALKRLLDVGLVSYVDAKTHRYFTGEDPHKLHGLATRREVAVQEARVALDELLPELESVLGSSEHRPAVRYYEGESGVRDILEDVLTVTERAESKTYRIYSSSTLRDLVASAWLAFTKTRIRRGIRVRAISLGEGGTTAGLDERKWLTKKTNAPTYIFIYEGKTAYVAADEKKRLFGVIIEDSAIASTQTFIFDSLWQHLG
jgi:sugar-specific transcriptional regulator TrmB